MARDVRRAGGHATESSVSTTAQSLGGLTVLIANPSPDVYGSDLQMLESISALVDAGGRVVVAMPDRRPAGRT